MGNCQAIDSASLVIQHSSGRVEKLYWPVPATNIMKMNPGHYVALLLITTNFYCHATTNTTTQPLCVTRIKLLRPTDNLVLSHTYKLISAQEVMKGLYAKKYANIQNKQPESCGREAQKPSSDFELERKTQQVIKHDRHRSKTGASTNIATAKSKRMASLAEEHFGSRDLNLFVWTSYSSPSFINPCENQHNTY